VSFKNNVEEVQNLKLGVIFDCFNTSNGVQLDVTCDILGVLLPYIDGKTLIDLYTNDITRGLRHPSPQVNELVLKELSRAALDAQCISHLLTDTELLNSLEESLCSEEVGVSQSALKLFVNLCSSIEGRQVAFSPTVVELYHKVIGRNDVCKIRIFELLVVTSSKSEPVLILWDKTEVVHKLIDALHSEDVLSVLNIVELLSQLIATIHGLQYSMKYGIVEKLEQLLNRKSADDLAPLYIPGFLKFYGTVCSALPTECIEAFPSYGSLMLRVIREKDVSLTLAGLDALTAIGEEVRGKVALRTFGIELDECFRHIGSLIINSSKELRLSSLFTVATLIHVNFSDQSPESSTLTKEWFSLLSDNPINSIMQIAQQPFADLRKYGLKVLNSISISPWGVDTFLSYPGMIEYLLDRNADPDYDCKELKYQIIQNLLLVIQRGEVNVPFETESIERLKDFIRKGAFAKDIPPAIAFDEGS